MKVESEEKVYDDINITPMLDVAYVLLLIFIIMTTAGVQGVKVDLPKSSSKPAELSGPKSRAITVNNQGKIALDTVPVSLAELEAKLKEHQAKHKEFPVVVRGARQTQYEGIMNVLDVCGRLGITQVGLATVGPK